MRWHSLAVLAVLLLGGCTGPALRPASPERSNLERPGEEGDCARFIVALDEAIDAAGVADRQSVRIPGFPYLRADRFLASVVSPGADPARFEFWVERLRQRDLEARAVEIENLPDEVAAQLHTSGSGETLTAQAQRCAERLQSSDLGEPANRRRLASLAGVPPEYRLAPRVFGLYPLTSLAFSLGVGRLHAEFERVFEVPLADLAPEGRLTRFGLPRDAAPLPPPAVGEVLARSARNPLRLPMPPAEDLERLFATFAPVWEIDVSSNADRVGAPRWGDGELPTIRTEVPSVYTHVSYARLGAVPLLQLSYVVWFPSRPRIGALDLVGGHLDGITWRVTLAPDGVPLFYDAMHNCGCYYLAFPTERLRPMRSSIGWEEPVLVAQTLASGGGQAVIRVAARTHYIQRVYRERSPRFEIGYGLRPYDELRSLPRPTGGRRSLFDSNGLVRGTERLERYLFWPMGIPEPGAMRQWGTHAIAFVGRRHFDDPDLIERYFERAD